MESLSKLKGKTVKITQVKSRIRRSDKQKATLEGLGLRKIGQSREHKLTPQVLGMLEKVQFLVNVEEIK